MFSLGRHGSLALPSPARETGLALGVEDLQADGKLL